MKTKIEIIEKALALLKEHKCNFICHAIVLAVLDIPYGTEEFSKSCRQFDFSQFQDLADLANATYYDLGMLAFSESGKRPIFSFNGYPWFICDDRHTVRIELLEHYIKRCCLHT